MARETSRKAKPEDRGTHYFYAVVAADDEQRRAYLEDVYRLGRDF